MKCWKPNVYHTLPFQGMGDSHCTVLMIIYSLNMGSKYPVETHTQHPMRCQRKLAYRAEAPPKSNYAIMESRCRDICNLMCAKVNMFVRLPLNRVTVLHK